MRNCNDARLESASERSVGVCIRSLSLLPARFLKRRRHELLFQLEDSMRISRIMHSESRILGCGRRTRMEAQEQATMALVVSAVIVCRSCWHHLSRRSHHEKSQAAGFERGNRGVVDAAESRQLLLAGHRPSMGPG